MSEQQIIFLPIDCIFANPDNEKIFNMNDIDGLVTSIQETGFNGTIEVFELEKNKYEVISGHRRLLAARKAGLKEVPVIIQQIHGEADKAKNLVLSNIHNREISAMDKARAIEYYIDHVLKIEQPKCNTQNEVARIFNISVSTVKYLRRLLKYDKSLQDLVDKNLVPYAALIDVIKLDEDEQKELAQALTEAINLSDGKPLSNKEALTICKTIINKKELANKLAANYDSINKSAFIEHPNIISRGTTPLINDTIELYKPNNTDEYIFNEKLNKLSLEDKEDDFTPILDEYSFEEYDKIEDDTFTPKRTVSIGLINSYSALDNLESTINSNKFSDEQKDIIKERLETILNNL